MRFDLALLKRIATVTAVVLVAAVGLYGLKSYRCHERSMAFERQMEGIEQDAQEQLKIGASDAEVAQFFTQHKIPFGILSRGIKDGGFEAVGTLYTIGGCAPVGCGTDKALIGVRVRVDANGTTTDRPEVVNMYTDCS